MRSLFACVIAVLAPTAALAGHNEYSLLRKQGAANCNYANYAGAHSGALITKFSPIFDKCSNAQLRVSPCNASRAQAVCASSTALGRAYASSFAFGGSCGGSYWRTGIAFAGPERSGTASTTTPDGVDTVGVTLISVDPDSRSFTVDVTAMLRASESVYATDTVAFFAYRDTFAFKNDTRHVGVDAVAGGIVILHSPAGILEFPPVNGGNLFVPGGTIGQPAHEFSLHRQFTIADSDTVVVLATYGGGQGNAAVPATTPFANMILVGTLAVLACRGMRRTSAVGKSASE